MFPTLSRRSIFSARRRLCTVAADAKEETKKGMHPKKVIVFGGNGYVGQNVCRYALGRGAKVISINRSGRPAAVGHWVDDITWIRGDIFQGDVWREHLVGATGVVSCVGAFGSNEMMERINGDANINAVKEAKIAEVPNFVFISTGKSTMPSFVLHGYFDGKMRAEEAIHASYPLNGGHILRPGFIYGEKAVGGYTLPLQHIGRPLEMVLKSTGMNRLASAPGLSMLCTSPVSVEHVGAVAAAGALGELADKSHVYSSEDIARIGEGLKYIKAN